MVKHQDLRVQRLAPKALDQGAGRLRQAGQAPRGGPAVERIADHRVAAVAQVDADLVGASGQEAAFDEAGTPAGQRLAQPVTGVVF